MSVILWNGSGERVSTFKVEKDRIWMLITKSYKNEDLNVIQTKDMLFKMIKATIQKGKDIEAMCLISKDKKFTLESVSWKEIAINAIREGKR